MNESQNDKRILIAEDNPVSRRLLEATLKKYNYDVIVTTSGLEALEVLQSDNPPQLAVLDWIMPGMNGIDVCREIRKQKRNLYTFIIMLTSKGEKEDIIEGMDAGADDYITKPFNSHELKARIKAGRRIIDLERQLIAARNQLEFQATHDALTGILNRSAIMDILKKEIARAVRQNKPLSVIMADLDRFKDINDSHGHLAGDFVLCESVERIKSSLRPYDSIGRYGGEEFLIICPGCEKDDAANIAERIRRTVSGSEINSAEWNIHVTISIGVSYTEGGLKLGVEPLIRAADTALYTAKEKGRDRVEIAPQL